MLAKESIEYGTKEPIDGPSVSNRGSLMFFPLKWANPALFFIYFCLFKHAFKQFLQRVGM